MKPSPTFLKKSNAFYLSYLNKKSYFFYFLFLFGSFSILFFTSFYHLPVNQKQATFNPPVQFGEWESMGLGVNAIVYALAPDRYGNLYVGGNFTEAGGEDNVRIAKWKAEGGYWANNSTATGFNSLVRALVVDQNDQLFATGWFQHFGIAGEDFNYIASTSLLGPFWHGLGSGLSNHGKFLTTDVFGQTYVSGHFGAVDGEPNHGLAKWDGESWSDVGQPMWHSITAMTTDATGVFYAAGSFSATSSPSPAIVSWNGLVWDTLGVPDHLVNDIAIDTAGNVVVIGSFSSIDNVYAYHMARWDGVSWQGIHLPTYHSPRVIEIDGDNNIFVGGSVPNSDGYYDGFVLMWDGLSWKRVGEILSFSPEDIAIDTFGHLYIGGQFSEHNHIAKLNKQVEPFPPYRALTPVATTVPFSKVDLKVYPNPVNSILHIKGEAGIRLDVILFDVQGKEVLSFANIEDALDISSLSSGVYFVHLKQKSRHKVVKIFVK